MKAVLPTFQTHGHANRRRRLANRGWWIRAMILLCLGYLWATMLPAQNLGRPAARPPSRLRATAILELAANGRARLIPIVIKDGGRFFDGGLYHADPSPVTLESGTVYEAERAGDPAGLFTITQSQEVSGVWVGLGQWRSKDAAKPETKIAKTAPPDDSDDRPILRRPKPASAQPSLSASPAPTPAPTASPVPAPKTAAEGKPASAATPSPTPKASVTSSASSAMSSAMEDDPNRPILRRGKPAEHESADELPPLIVGKPGAAHSTPGAAAAGAHGAFPAGVEVLTAVSDAGGPDPRPYTMQLKPDERERYEKAVRQMAYAAVGKFAASRVQHKPAAAGEMADTQFHVYDAHSNNEPDLVFSAALPERLPHGASTDFRYLVTVVARVDIYGDPHQLLAQVTDSTHLDAYPRLELVDVVDAEGTGAGQLLFREISDTGYDYVLYRIGADKLWPLFQGAGQNF